MSFLTRRKPLDLATPHEAHHQLRRSLSWPHLVALGVGAIVGTGIYTLIGVGAGLAGPGVMLAFALAAIINQAGITWLSPGNVEPLPLLLLVSGQTGMIVGTTLGLICIAVVSAWWPAYRAAQLNVVEALRHV